jgi:hypothetical protein
VREVVGGPVLGVVLGDVRRFVAEHLLHRRASGGGLVGERRAGGEPQQIHVAAHRLDDSSEILDLALGGVGQGVAALTSAATVVADHGVSTPVPGDCFGERAAWSEVTERHGSVDDDEHGTAAVALERDGRAILARHGLGLRGWDGVGHRCLLLVKCASHRDGGVELLERLHPAVADEVAELGRERALVGRGGDGVLRHRWRPGRWRRWRQ